ncbi:MAG TPA: transcription termination factor Rho, partial [Firmicutes bacterium]|nr:transcription termination factor Rho [Bacillota bacterium]
IPRSGTRREELMLSNDTLELMWALRRSMGTSSPADFLEAIVERLKKTENNATFLENLHNL